jgi:hypothetical protein
MREQRGDGLRLWHLSGDHNVVGRLGDNFSIGAADPEIDIGDHPSGRGRARDQLVADGARVRLMTVS